MALWKKVQTLEEATQNSIYKFYEQNSFPIEIRNIFAQFIEEEILGRQLEEDNPNHLDSIRHFINTLLAKIESFVKSADESCYIQEKLNNTLDSFKLTYRGNELRLFRKIKACLKMETEALAAKAYATVEILQNCEALKERMSKIQGILQLLDNKSKEVDRALSQMNIHTGSHCYHIGNYQLQGDRQIFDARMDNDRNEIFDMVRQVEESLCKHILKISEQQKRILYNLSLWKYQQQTSCSDPTLELKSLQRCCEELAEVIRMTSLNMHNTPTLNHATPYLGHSDKMLAMKKQIMSLLSSLLKASFVVEEQPPQVMKQTAKFPNSMKVRHLFAHKLNAHLKSRSYIKGLLIDEEVAQKLYSEENYVIQIARGEIATTSPKVLLDFDPKEQTFSALFKNCQLKNFKRLEKKDIGKELVTEDKFCVYFETEFLIGDLPFKVWTISRPSVIITHGSQEAQAVATIFWDNAFGKLGRVPFVVPTEVPWMSFIEAFRRKFTMHTGREITAVQENYLKTKLFGGSASETVSWKSLCKENMPDTPFTFWNWCYEIMKLIESFLRQPWCDGYITGIIDKKAAEQMLFPCSPGTFLVRFSDSVLGAVSISWRHSDGKVYSVNPLTKTDLQLKNLSDWIMSLNQLQFLYPQIPKANAFKRLCKQTAKHPGYVPLVPEYRIDLPMEKHELLTDKNVPDVSEGIPDEMDTLTEQFPSCQFAPGTSECFITMEEQVKSVLNDFLMPNSEDINLYSGDHYMPHLTVLK